MSRTDPEIRSLAGVDWAPLAAAFNAAFSDYVVPMTITADGLAAMQRRRGYAADVSFGAYDGERLVGFVLTCVDGDRAYNSGTGVVPAHRGGGLGRRLVDAVIASVRARSYALEVIETNEPAAALYRSAGFVERRRLQVWTYAPPGGAPAPEVGELAAPDPGAIAADADHELPWQNSLASLRRATEPYVALGDARGAAIVFPGSADLPLLCVRRDARRGGLGTRLLAAAAARAGRPIRTMVDDRDAGIAGFLEAAGATRLVRQLEMVRELGGVPRRRDPG
ncbi:MAG TPA: GNAT family N-acetyltransferase [Kofleriaceae bacterium]|nr:GNAT family N-acetyltransferase [Kofleriaceae bacterium]